MSVKYKLPYKAIDNGQFAQIRQKFSETVDSTIPENEITTRVNGSKITFEFNSVDSLSQSEVDALTTVVKDKFSSASLLE